MLRNLRKLKRSRCLSSLSISRDVEIAIKNNIPIVALESTIISHGMPFPQNKEVAHLMQAKIREKGCVPATIAIIRGVPTIGVDSFTIDNVLCQPPNLENKVLKASRRDLSFACANSLNAATTVSSTMLLAEKACIATFATGGIGGVHYGAEQTMDISTDLSELGKTPVAVVCAGIKSILDIKKSLEVLETNGVPVVGYRCKEIPSFFTNDSGIALRMSVNNSMEAAALMIKQFDDLKLGNGIVFTVPNPRPIQPSQSVNTLIRQSIEEANARGISGAAITPFLLQRIQQMTEGQSLASNISLALNNCSVGADIAFNYAKQKQKLSSPGNVIDLRKKFTGPREKNQSSVLVFGGAVIDHVAFPNKSLTRDMLGTSNPGTMITSYGGVGRNIAECIGRLQGHVRLITAVGNDSLGEGLITHAKTECGIDTADILVGDDTCRTASYTAVHNHDGGDLLVAIADMDIFPRKLNAAYTREVFEKVCGKGASLPKIVVADGNMSPETFQYIASKSLNLGIPLFFECTSVAKCVLPITSNSLQQVSLIKPNVKELVALVTLLYERRMIASVFESYVIEALQNLKSGNGESQVASLSILAAALFNCMKLAGSEKHVLLSAGKLGLIWVTETDITSQRLVSHGVHASKMGNCFVYQIPPAPIAESEIINTSGAGDTFCGTLIYYLAKSDWKGRLTLEALLYGLLGARESLKVKTAVPINLKERMPHIEYGILK